MIFYEYQEPPMPMQHSQFRRRLASNRLATAQVPKPDDHDDDDTVLRRAREEDAGSMMEGERFDGLS